jgi:phosphatidylglycerol:prolipoprotein diacylglycerol transferase
MPLAYPCIMILAATAAALVARHTKRDLALTRRQRWMLLAGAYCGAILGAKLPYVLLDWKGLVTGTAWLENGKTILAGIVGGYFGVEVAKVMAGVKIKTGDGFAVPAALGIGIGRWGCFVAGCCYGLPTTLPWGVNFGDGVHRHPTQIYESLFHLSAALVLWRLQRRGIWRGQLIKAYLLAYLMYRFVTEFLRPEPRVLFSLTAYQWAALVLAPVFAALWWRDSRALLLTTP